tara:strand:- start:4147 stop:4692 length:546 start_codon:yes stop_codon:yes gene_type:complete
MQAHGDHSSTVLLDEELLDEELLDEELLDELLQSGSLLDTPLTQPSPLTQPRLPSVALPKAIVLALLPKDHCVNLPLLDRKCLGKTEQVWWYERLVPTAAWHERLAQTAEHEHERLAHGAKHDRLVEFLLYMIHHDMRTWADGSCALRDYFLALGKEGASQHVYVESLMHRVRLLRSQQPH